MEANLGFTCRKDGITYKGKSVVQEQQLYGVHKRLIYLTLREKGVPLWGLEAVYRNNEIVGHLRRGEWAYTLNCALGQCYIKSGNYQIEVMGKLYDADIHLRSPFDPKGLRIMGEY